MKQINENTIQEYLSEAEEILESLANEVVSLEESAEAGDPDPEVVNAIFRGAHSLKGISAMFGFDDVAQVAHKLESLLDSIRMGRVVCSRPVLEILFEGVDVMKSLSSSLTASGPTHDPRVVTFVEKILAAAEGRLVAEPQQVEEPPEELTLKSLDLPEDTFKVLTDYEIHRIESNLKDPRKTLVSVLIALPLMTLDTEMEKVSGVIKPMGEIISTLPAPGDIKPDELDFQLIVALKVTMQEASTALETFGAKVESLLKKLPPKVLPAPPVAPPKADDEAFEASIPPAASPKPEAGAPQQPRNKTEEPIKRELEKQDAELRSISKTIRVDLPKLDTLMNLVGELVLTKGRFLAINERLRTDFGFSGEVLEMAKAQKELERRLGELQQAVMEVRMVPMGQLFSKLNRVVRKILQGSNKKVNLEISGSDTQLDKLIVEDISDPLIHVIRNAVDHGIEHPDVRKVVGKPLEGRVSVSAAQQGNYVIIEVADDGAGMDLEKIKAKAIRTGLLSQDEEVDKKRLLEFVFMPGFSTKDQVSEISGRGVGMDVLRKNVANTSGIIELDTEKGKGTAVRIILPITLAIIQALLIETSGELYAIPLNTVLETVAVEEEHLRSLEGRPMLRLRERTLPLVDVGALFGIAPPKKVPPFAVIVGIAEKRVAFGVDGLLTQRDLVIKSLGSRLSGLRGISGATDLGDNKTVLILDVAEMIEEVYETI